MEIELNGNKIAIYQSESERVEMSALKFINVKKWEGNRKKDKSYSPPVKRSKISKFAFNFFVAVIFFLQKKKLWGLLSVSIGMFKRVFYHVIWGKIKTRGILGYAWVCSGIARVFGYCSGIARVLLGYFLGIAWVCPGITLVLLYIARVCSGMLGYCADIWVLLGYCSGIARVFLGYARVLLGY